MLCMKLMKDAPPRYDLQCSWKKFSTSNTSSTDNNTNTNVRGVIPIQQPYEWLSSCRHRITSPSLLAATPGYWPARLQCRRQFEQRAESSQHRHPCHHNGICRQTPLRTEWMMRAHITRIIPAMMSTLLWIFYPSTLTHRGSPLLTVKPGIMKPFDIEQ